MVLGPTKHYAALAFLAGLLIFTLSCESKDKYSGTYRAAALATQKQAEVVIELKPSGEGVWRFGNDEVPFSWYLKGGELRVNTRDGGVIVGTIKGDTIQITLPGSKKMTFKR